MKHSWDVHPSRSYVPNGNHGEWGVSVVNSISGQAGTYVVYGCTMQTVYLYSRKTDPSRMHIHKYYLSPGVFSSLVAVFVVCTCPNDDSMRLYYHSCLIILSMSL